MRTAPALRELSVEREATALWVNTGVLRACWWVQGAGEVEIKAMLLSSREGAG